MEYMSSKEGVREAIQLMQGVLKQESSLLRGMMNENEGARRETVKAEVEGKDNLVMQDKLQSEIGRFKSELTSAKKERETLIESVSKAKKAKADLESSNGELKKAVRDLEKARTKFSSEEALLKGKTSKLQIKRDKLSSDVKRLKDLRTKYMAEIASFKDQEE